MGHSFRATGFSTSEHQLILKTGSDGVVSVYCQTHGCYIIYFLASKLCFDGASCLFNKDQEIEFNPKVKGK